MMRVLYSFNKTGREAEIWDKEISMASDLNCTYIPFNHVRYANPQKYIRAQLLDDLYFKKDPGLMRLYKDIDAFIKENNINVIMVDTCNPYHPDFLKRLNIYKVLRIADGPISAYDRDFAYIHAFDHILYHSRAYSSDMTMPEKLFYCRATKFDFWPLAVYDSFRDLNLNISNIFDKDRKVDIVYVGALHLGKMQLLSEVKRKFNNKLDMHGQANFKQNLYFNLRFGFPGWVKPILTEEYVDLYKTSKIGFNVHNRGKYTVGSYRLFELPANGVMQISDGGEYLKDFYEIGTEIINYENQNDLIEKIEYFLKNPEERMRIATAAFLRTIADHTMPKRMSQLTELLRSGLSL